MSTYEWLMNKRRIQRIQEEQLAIQQFILLNSDDSSTVTGIGGEVIPVLDIVRPDLQYYLTAGNSSSYPGTGTSWTDISPNGYVATIVGATYSSTDGGSILFNGTGNYIDTNQSLSAETFTIGAWFKTSTSGIQMIISKEVEAGWPWNYRIWLNGGQLVGDISQSGASSVQISSPLSTYNNGNWYQVFFTRNDSTLRLYVNGIEVSNTPDTLTGSIINAQEVWLGLSDYTGGAGAGNYQFSGNISEFMMYNRVLTADEVLQNFNATKTRFGI
jgi:hypothetical protein